MHCSTAIAATLILLTLAVTPVSGADAISDREVEVLSALINHGLDANTKMVVLAEQTSGDPASISRDPATAGVIAKDLEIPISAVDDWARRNATLDSIDRPLNLNVSYQVMNAKIRAELFAGVEPAAGWQKFFAQYSGAPGWLRVSHVGFDDSLSHALVYLELACGADCGSGQLFHLMHAPTGGWTVRAGATVWMVK